MKKILVSLMLLVMTALSAHAQFEKEVWYVNASLTGLDLSPVSYTHLAHKRKVLIDKGRISHKQAIEKAEKEFAIYRNREMDLLESDFDKEIKRLKEDVYKRQVI